MQRKTTLKLSALLYIGYISLNATVFLTTFFSFLRMPYSYPSLSPWHLMLFNTIHVKAIPALVG